jgi:hypothetical protein
MQVSRPRISSCNWGRSIGHLPDTEPYLCYLYVLTILIFCACLGFDFVQVMSLSGLVLPGLRGAVSTGTTYSPESTNSGTQTRPKRSHSWVVWLLRSLFSVVLKGLWLHVVWAQTKASLQMNTDQQVYACGVSPDKTLPADAHWTTSLCMWYEPRQKPPCRCTQTNKVMHVV